MAHAQGNPSRGGRRRAVRIALALVSAAAATIAGAGMVIGRHGQRLNHSAIYRYGRSRFNLITSPSAGSCWSLFALLRHRGRRSGQWYATPVAVLPLRGAMLIPATYGEDADWCRNILASGSCVVTWRGKSYAGEDARLISLGEVLAALPAWQRPGYRLFGIRQYLRVRPRLLRDAR